jgi:hypothetical protein
MLTSQKTNWVPKCLRPNKLEAIGLNGGIDHAWPAMSHVRI